MRRVKEYAVVLHPGAADERHVYMPRHPAKVVWEATELRSKLLSLDTKAKYEKAVKQVCSWYDDLTFDDVMEGMDSQALMSFLYDSCDYLVNGTIGWYEDLLDENFPGTSGDDQKNESSAVAAE